MTMKDILYRIKPPCDKCPYKLGLVHTVVNPCPQCKENGYKTYEQFKKEPSRKSTKARRTEWRIILKCL